MKSFLFRITIVLLLLFSCHSGYTQQVIKLGIVGLDTSHSTAFIKLINGENAGPEYDGFRIVAAYPHGSRTIESSYKRIPEYTEIAKQHNVKITASIAELLREVDCVFLETNDGTMHLEQAREIIQSGKPVFIDKPIAATLPDILAIYELAEKKNVPVFSSSALRFSKKTQELRNGSEGKIIGVDSYSPCTNEPSHAGFFWYGIHGVETLYTLMGQGCETVTCVSTDNSDVVVGLWKDKRIGTFRGIREGSHTYGGTVFCEKKVVPAGGYEGYEQLLLSILQFFKTKTCPVPIEETLEIYTFMEAANESIRQGGTPVSMSDVYSKALKEAEKLK